MGKFGAFREYRINDTPFSGFGVMLELAATGGLSPAISVISRETVTIRPRRFVGRIQLFSETRLLVRSIVRTSGNSNVSYFHFQYYLCV